ncbi:MAG: hypothetical protein ACLFV8_13635, partial [Alphaproteobacteria bacterium]
MAGDSAGNGGDGDADHIDPRKPWESRAFRDWWEADFSWEGLAAKRQRPRDEDSSTLQDYWREQGLTEDDLIDFAGRKWTPFHLPLWDLEGNKSPKAEWSGEQLEAFHAGLKKLLHAAPLPETETRGGGPDGKDGDEDSAGEEDEGPPPDLPDAFLDGVFISGDFDISGHEVRGRTHLTRAWVAGEFRCTRAKFRGDVFGQWSVIQDWAFFAGARFQGRAVFKSVTFFRP